MYEVENNKQKRLQNWRKAYGYARVSTEGL